jgi:hypothetical protein
MNSGRIALIATCVLVAGLGGWFAIARWDDANRVAAITSALAGIAAIGVAVWAALRGSGRNASQSVSRSGNATGKGGRANSGISGSNAASVREAKVRRTGDAHAEDGGSANTGIRFE